MKFLSMMHQLYGVGIECGDLMWLVQCYIYVAQRIIKVVVSKVRDSDLYKLSFSSQLMISLEFPHARWHINVSDIPVSVR